MSLSLGKSGLSASLPVTARVLALVLLCLAITACTRGKGSQTSTAGGMAPDFSAKDLSGNEVRLSGFAGKVVLLEFFATWCPPCRASIPTLVTLQNRYRDKGLTILAVSVDEGENLPATLASFSKEQGINYTVLLGNQEVTGAYQVSGIPVAFLIDKTGKISATHMGALEDSGNEMSAAIEKLL